METSDSSYDLLRRHHQSSAPGAQVMRFYLFRSDPEQTGKAKYKNQILTQIIMPIPAFIHTAPFFERGLKQFVEQGVISPDMADGIKQVTKVEQQT